jgi:hypothetical protein
MKRIATVLSAFLLGALARGQAQTSPQEPHLVFSISAGMSSGGDLWTLPDHPQPVVGGTLANQDTMTIGRVMRPGIVAGLAASYYTSPRFGWTAEVTYFGIASEQRCAGPATYQPEADNINQQACDRAQGLHIATSVVGFLGGATYRFFPDSRVEPFVRVVGGLGLLGNSYIQTNGIIRSTQCQTVDDFCTLTLVKEEQESQFTFVAALSAGFSFTLSPGYKVRFEGRDVITSLPVTTGNGQSSDPAIVTTGRVIKHVAVFTLGIDVILERRHTRRY